MIVFDFPIDVQGINDPDEKINKHKYFVHQLNTEMVKLNALKGELPLCMSILNEAIEKLNREIVCSTNMNEGLISKEFKSVEDENLKDTEGMLKSSDNDKKNWMRDVKLWNAEDPKSDTEVHVVSHLGSEMVDKGKAYENPSDQMFWKFNKTEGSSVPLKMPTSLTVLESPGQSISKQINGPVTLTHPQFIPYANDPSRKRRRYWSAELHEHFVRALKHLGSANATPKKIKEQMRIGDLTTDEIKSHLQQYKRHCRLAEASTSTVPSPQTSLRISEEHNGSSSGCDGADKE